MNGPPVATTPAAGAASVRVLGLTLSAPVAAFRTLAARPLWALVLALLVALGMLAIGVGFSKVAPDDYARMIEEAGKPVPPQFDDDPQRFLGIVRWAAVLSAGLLSPLLYVVLAAIFLAVFRLLGSEIDFRRSLSVTLHGLLPLGVAAAIGTVIAFASDEIDPRQLQGGGLVPSNLGFLADPRTAKALHTLLTSVDLFSIWSIVLLVIGFRVVGRVSTSDAGVAVGVVWGLGIVFKVALAAVF